MGSSESGSTPPAAGMTDLHNHLMPGVDDGAADDDEAREGVLALRDAGVRRIATTPHVDASSMLRPSWERRVAGLTAAWERLEAIGRAAAPDVRLHRAAEVRLDIPDPDLSDDRIRLAGGRAVLVEFAYFTVPPFSERVVAQLVERGWTPVIAHPERYRDMPADPRLVATWRAAGAWIQVNAGSFMGRYGSDARTIAVTLLAAGQIDCIASDYHSRGKPELRTARSWLEGAGAGEQARLLMDVNPARILDGQTPVPVPALEKKSGLMARIWKTVRGG